MNELVSDCSEPVCRKGLLRSNDGKFFGGHIGLAGTGHSRSDFAQHRHIRLRTLSGLVSKFGVP